ncbi:hypothetical protein GCQ56_00050 [Marinifilum sp. N1E240]|uniref:hypothetical protein n=1 Tax=Marinifilum sp. N1E240 TaxID=2608082 RepID=UPI00128C72F5|nr:hypothetical protein [Marinifilum sp. N1E240]MPQ45389.1 hypothetical protein [Marinifilum sp. N1E240]
MKQLSVTQKKWLKSIHLIAAGVWITTGLIMFLVQFMNDDIKTGDQLHLMNQIIHFIDMKILVPSAILCLLTGWMYSQFTKWGYFKHAWLIFKWIITVLIIVLGTIYSGPWIEKLVLISGEIGLDSLHDADYQWYENSQNIMGVCMTGTLIVSIFISIFKPGKSKKKTS